MAVLELRFQDQTSTIALIAKNWIVFDWSCPRWGPEWTLTIDLEDTVQERQKFEETKINYGNETTWMAVNKEDNKPLGACVPTNSKKCCRP